MFTDFRLLKHPYTWLALGFGVGLSPKAPGTVGSLAAVLLWWLLLADLSLPLQLTVIVAGFGLGIAAGDWLIARTGVDDPRYIVWDEFIGQWLALLLLPKSLAAAALAFAAFRLFDIAKRGPVSWADKRFSGGFGVMADDAIAGLMAFVLVQAVWRLSGLA